MKFLGVSGVFDYAGLNRSSRYRACSCCLPRITRASASGLTVYGAEYPPRLSSVYASLCTSRYPAQDSRPSGSLLLSRKALSSSTSCRLSGKAMALIGLRMMPTFPSPPLKFRTAGFPQYGFKAGISDKAFPQTGFAFVLRAHCCHRVLPALCQGRCAIRHLRASGPSRSTPGALAPVRVMLSRSIITLGSEEARCRASLRPPPKPCMRISRTRLSRRFRRPGCQ
jgi:hypothetical protein